MLQLLLPESRRSFATFQSTLLTQSTQPSFYEPFPHLFAIFASDSVSFDSRNLFRKEHFLVCAQSIDPLESLVAWNFWGYLWTELDSSSFELCLPGGLRWLLSDHLLSGVVCPQALWISFDPGASVHPLLDAGNWGTVASEPFYPEGA